MLVCPLCHNQVLWGVCWLQPAMTFGALFFWGGSWWRLRQLLNCGFGKRAGLPHLESTAGTPPRYLFNPLACPILRRSADWSAMQSWDFQTMYPKESFVWEPDWLGCVTVLRAAGAGGGAAGSGTSISLISSACTNMGRGRSAHPHPTGL